MTCSPSGGNRSGGKRTATAVAGSSAIPPAPAAANTEDSGRAGLRELVSRRREPRRALRRCRLHRGEINGNLLPAELPATMPKRSNVSFFPTAAGAQAAGFRACRRCRPEVAPGSPEWDARADVVGRAMRLIADGVVDREGVEGLSRRLGYTSRHIHRQLVAEVGVGPLALGRAHRAQTARMLLDATQMPMADVAFASGFASVRQFNDVTRQVFGATPSQLRSRSKQPPMNGGVSVRIPFRSPYAIERTLHFLGHRCVPGVEVVADGIYRRTVRLPHEYGVVELLPGADHFTCRAQVRDVRDLGTLVQRCRSFLDLNCDPAAIHDVLGRDPCLRPALVQLPGLRVVGTLDAHELAVRAVLGQQVSVKAATTPRSASWSCSVLQWTPPFIASPTCSRVPRRSPRQTCRRSGCLNPDVEPSPDWRRRLPQGISCSMPAQTGTISAPGSWQCRGSDRGRRRTSRCVRSTTPMRSFQVIAAHWAGPLRLVCRSAPTS